MFLKNITVARQFVNFTRFTLFWRCKDKSLFCYNYFFQMKTLFTRYLYLFLIFLLPVLVVVIFFFVSSSEVSEIGYNTSVQWNRIDKYLGNPLYNWGIFMGSYGLYFFIYLTIFLIHRKTDFHFYLIHSISFSINFILISINAENRCLIPLSIICFVFFILNIFKTSKNFEH